MPEMRIPREVVVCPLAFHIPSGKFSSVLSSFVDRRSNIGLAHNTASLSPALGQVSG